MEIGQEIFLEIVLDQRQFTRNYKAQYSRKISSLMGNKMVNDSIHKGLIGHDKETNYYVNAQEVMMNNLDTITCEPSLYHP